MVHKIINNKYRIFTETFLLTIIILLIGFSLGFYVEYFKSKSIIDNYSANEIDALDLKLQNYYYQIMSKESCDAAITQNFIFADELYNEGLDLEKYEDSAQISNSYEIDKKRYVLFKTELWLNTILLKEKCGSPFDSVVYFYSNNPGQIKEAQQKIISNMLKDIKEEKGNKIVLIPIAGDLDLKIVDVQKKFYNITSLPAIIINEKIILENIESKSQIEQYIK